ncbi:MAG: TonB-dependent receptor [Cyclobacteriaceae bacterium]
MNFLKTTLAFVLLLSCTGLFAQKGTLRGKIKEESQEGLPFANVQVSGTTTGATTDFEGNYSLPLDPGTYAIQVTFIGYNPIEITGVVIEAGEITLLDATLAEETTTLETVVITAEEITNTEAALLNVQRKSANLLDGISSQNFKRIGDNNLASAVQRVPGVSVQDGKYIYVRGLGDRYTKSILNGVDIPGLDPDRNTVQMDIFPTNLIDNVLVMKSATADLPADFTGGVVNIQTKDFPEEKSWTINGSIGYNPNMHLNSNYVTYPGSSTDALGFDNSLRDDPKVDPPNSLVDPEEARRLTNEFSPQLATMRENSGVDYSLGVSGGNQINKANYSIGYNTAFNYRNTTTYFEAFENGEYFKNEDLSNNELRVNRVQVGDLGTNNVLMSGLVGGTIKTDRSKIGINVMHLQNGETRAGVFEQEEFINQVNTLKKDNLEYSQRAITNFLISGKHANANADLDIEWKFSPTFSKIQDKDLRVTPFRIDGGTPEIESSETGDPTRIWRELDESNYVARVDITKQINLFNNDGKVKAGSYYTHKNRDFSIPIYRYLRFEGNPDWSGDPNQVHEFGFIRNTTDASNSFESTQQNIAGYVSLESKFSESLKTIVGLRVEKYDQWYSGQDQAYETDSVGGRFFDNEKILDMMDLFPSLNMIYSFNEKFNLRGSYSRTIARPSFKEASVAQIFDPVSGRTFIGNIDLKETDINNFDLRLERFLERGQMFAVSGFYKTFDDPIELVAFSEAAPEDFQPRNVGQATVYGAEVELRKNLAFISPSLTDLSFNVNATFLKSIQEMDKSEGGEYESRLNNARVGQVIDDTRPLQGQSPYMINAGIVYQGLVSNLELGMFYNVQGRRLQVVGIGAAPDVYEMPFNSLNFNMTKRFGVDQKQSVGFGISNILGDDRESRYASFDGEKEVYLEEYRFSLLSPERRFTLRYSYTF